MGETELRDSLSDMSQAFLEYRATHDLSLRNDLVLHYSYIPQIVAKQMRSVLGNYNQVEDVVHQGLLTLMDCIEKYQPEKGVKFETYAFMRIRNANIDYARKQDWIPRRVRKLAREITEGHDALCSLLMREPTPKELAEHLNITEEQLNEGYREIAGTATISFDASIQNADGEELFSPAAQVVDENPTPEQALLKSELQSELAAALDTLTERERLVISLYYQEELRFHEIAEVMSISASRACQLHSKAILKLQQKMKNIQNM